MGIYDAQAAVLKLNAAGLNFWKWDAVITLYAQTYNATEVLTGAKLRLSPLSYSGFIDEPEPLHRTTRDLNNEEHHSVQAWFVLLIWRLQ
jgi:hypothetical protein